jgi:hypothetical protein
MGHITFALAALPVTRSGRGKYAPALSSQNGLNGDKTQSSRAGFFDEYASVDRSPEVRPADVDRSTEIREH